MPASEIAEHMAIYEISLKLREQMVRPMSSGESSLIECNVTDRVGPCKASAVKDTISVVTFHDASLCAPPRDACCTTISRMMNI